MADKHTEEYQKVLRSTRWKKLRKDRLWSSNWRCERCQKAGTEKTLSLHHKSYERLGNEQPDDLELLCQSCHEGADEERVARNEARRARALEEARLDGWATKVYGDNWEYWLGRNEAKRQFRAWIDDQYE